MLRLVHPAPSGQDRTHPPKYKRSPALALTSEEVRHFRAALQNIARAYGSQACLAAAIGVPVETLRHTKRRQPSAMLVLRVAQAGGLTMEALLGPALTEAGRCKACGSRVGERKVAS